MRKSSGMLWLKTTLFIGVLPKEVWVTKGKEGVGFGTSGIITTTPVWEFWGFITWGTTLGSGWGGCCLGCGIGWGLCCGCGCGWVWGLVWEGIDWVGWVGWGGWVGCAG